MLAKTCRALSRRWRLGLPRAGEAGCGCAQATLGDVIVVARFKAEDGVGIGVVAREHNDGRLETVPAQDAHGFAAVDVRQADIHDHQIDLSLFGSLHALAAILRRDSFKDAMRRTKAASVVHSPSSHCDVRETYRWIMQSLVRQPRLSSTVHWS
jgi:hypothetical protein